MSSGDSQTKVALYVVAYSYDLEKVSESTRIPLLSIQSLQKGKIRTLEATDYGY